MTNQLKRCSRCGEDKAIEDFYRHPRGKFGVGCTCKPCNIASSKAWNKKHPERHAAAKLKHRRLYPERGNERMRLWHVANPGRNAELVREWRIKNPEHARALSLARRRAPGKASAAQIRDRVAVFGGKCWMCGEDWQCIDHVIPIKFGGTNWPANLRPACTSCNLRKGSKIMHKLKDAS